MINGDAFKGVFTFIAVSSMLITAIVVSVIWWIASPSGDIETSEPLKPEMIIKYDADTGISDTTYVYKKID